MATALNQCDKCRRATNAGTLSIGDQRLMAKAFRHIPGFNRHWMQQEGWQREIVYLLELQRTGELPKDKPDPFVDHRRPVVRRIVRSGLLWLSHTSYDLAMRVLPSCYGIQRACATKVGRDGGEA